MFEALMDEVSRMLTWSWPVTEGEVTDAELDESEEECRIWVGYKFSIGADGPYVGEAFWAPRFSFYLDQKLTDALEQMYVGRQIQVRYKPNDPSINRIYGGVERYL